MQIIENDEETFESSPERLNKSYSKHKYYYALPDVTNCKAQMLSSQPKKSGKWKDWINVKVVGADQPN